MLDVCVLGRALLPDEYKDTVAGQFIDIMRTGKLVPNGDKDKAMKAVYQLVVGEGFGAGKEKEKFMPLGLDMTTRMSLIQDQLAHAKEVFGDITNGVGITNRVNNK
ncbi:hypothetical protein RRF57_005316 [Xylaria bambusicola]|uniref:Uncharacterized protein n=1 Tax=Xylaria bambusicola TaxID=326684 RepID=A0AAN7Z969_9PEZI